MYILQQAEQLGLGHAVLSARRAVSEPFAVLLADDFIVPMAKVLQPSW